MEQCIKGVKHLMASQIKRCSISNVQDLFTEHSKTYIWTNENINAYLNLVNFEEKNIALTVAGSGDQAFNLISKGILNIDTFDTNPLAEYFAFGIKRAMILKYSYQEFLRMMQELKNPQLEIRDLNDIVISLFPFMDRKHCVFWRAILDYNYRAQKFYGTDLNLFRMITLNNNYPNLFNNYLIDEEHYNEFRKRLSFANITFKCANAKDLTCEYTGQYDFILLSNILDYFYSVWGRNWSYEKLRNYEKELGNILKPEGILFLKYIFTYDNITIDESLFPLSKVTIKDLDTEEIYKFPKSDDLDELCGIILKRNK